MTSNRSNNDFIRYVRDTDNGNTRHTRCVEMSPFVKSPEAEMTLKIGQGHRRWHSLTSTYHFPLVV